ncbi:hypothetical protein LGL08_07745 [Clostridium estertheticum]|uniref:hypothetical protein n=1 Tax=Clostridium estertheticum TaxID=238834 RepID=UPI001CF2B2C1|nr:hypothetical protein [Clostridium estertheticum]MCB2308321.1 hypothetical protein [Clostridium estertheticum]MCB2346484.1 hypothetical protein [Clostridium estertheticum]MCB2349452.1 hypothetical protein [Clostridium estertheticum]WAG46429.1 hypothetical protein LL127_02420 [Clostridium estertheticum]
MTKKKFYMMTTFALTFSLTFGSTVFADSLRGITSTKNIYINHASNRLTDNQLYSKKSNNAISNLISIGSLHDITIHEPTTGSNLNLQSTILVRTTEGNMLVPVEWSNYSGGSINTTTKLSGKVVLPTSILNPYNIQLDVTQTVTYKGDGLCSNLGAVRYKNITDIPPATTARELISNLSYNGKALTSEMSPIIVDNHNNRLDGNSIVNEEDSLEIIDGEYTRTYNLSILVGTPSNSSSLLSIIPPQHIAVPITGMESSLNLPSIIRIDTTTGVVNLPVQWNIPVDLKISKNVEISGNIVLPDNIYNLERVQLPVYQQLNYRPLGISSSLGNIYNRIILDIPVGTSVSSLIEGLTNDDSYTITLKDKDNNILKADATIVTGDVLVATSGNTDYNFYLSTKTSNTR